MSVFLAFLPLYAKDLGMAGAGLPFAIYAVVVVVLRIRFAKLPDTMGAARLSGAALAVGAVGLAIFGLVATPVGILIGTVVFALGVTFMFPALIALAVSRVDEMERGSAVGTASAFFDLAFGLGPAVFGVLATTIGFGGTFLVSAVIAAFGAALLVARRGAVETPLAARASGGG
jgi:MFS family permease